MNTKDFRTKTEFLTMENGRLEGVWPIGIDIGYSAVKGFAPNGASRFPSFARKKGPLDNFEFAVKTPDSVILYRDDTNGDIWLVGELAQNIMESGDTSASEASLYSRERYYSPMFRVITETGLGISLLGNGAGMIMPNDRIQVQTGLPERYMNDKNELVSVMTGEHSFSLKIGDRDWAAFHFVLNEDDISVIPQPKGSLFSVCIDRTGRFLPQAKDYLTSSTVVLDIGFGTFDTIPIRNGMVENGETYSDLGMRRILQETTKNIKDDFNVEVTVPEMQKWLDKGYIISSWRDKDGMHSKKHDFSDQLQKATEKVCNEALTRIEGSVNLLDYSYVIVTGGTGEAWLPMIKDRFKNLETLTILCGNQNDGLPFVYSNVRGYYLYRRAQCSRENRGN